ncbi:uncharacterized protein YcbK (DUF882 family) [Gellertiella hungarica]|uniref:Murein endopeptidase K n=2 Tax=Gellertiella hungarica TaxID=1572859 RepID=A0A7W6J1K4_9HYPH|nr:DUF882 domain-containing protein [Gellertiella hungarica]MBB4063116.1 uncharacterized protein YcbK (DUF882 family) [Gellertiella hungarica]
MASHADAQAETRSLKLYFVHTGEKAVITFKRNGVYDRQGLQQLNRFLRDWRRNQPTKMDPRLFDLIWEVYRQSGSRTYINVVCGFRSPETNSMLRSRTKGVAEKSQHMLGKAMDFFIPDVKLAKLREIGMKMQVGGVGFYPRSGSPFVHMDVGNVRAWPRMTRQELVRLFPNGRTLHLPSDGKPLPGYQEAMADYKRRVGSTHIEIADTGGSKKKGLLAFLFGGGADEGEDNASAESAETAVASAAPTPRKEQVLTNPSSQPILAAAGEEPAVAVNAPIPLGRPAFNDQVGNSGVASALVEPQENSAAAALAAASMPQPAGEESYPDLQAYNIPVPTLLGKRLQNGDAQPEAAIETAALGVPDQATELADVPVPVSRPSGSEALLANAEGAEEAVPDEQEVAALSPDAAAQLENSTLAAKGGPIATVPEVAAVPAAEAAGEDQAATDEAYTTDEGENEEEVAALEGHPDATSDSFGDSFDQPVAASADASPISQGLPVKAGRPTPKDAAVAANGQKPLTGDMLAKWAMNNAHFDDASSKVKAPRFVSLAMRAQPVQPVTGGFTTKVATIDPGRFSGSAPAKPASSN